MNPLDHIVMAPTHGKPVGLSKPPGMLGMASNFVRAAAGHLAAGRPSATDEQVAERFAICQQCELYEARNPAYGRCLHPSCGCQLKSVGVHGLNKLRWADQGCPLKKWLPIPPPEG